MTIAAGNLRTADRQRAKLTTAITTALWRVLALVDLARPKQGWGAQPRRGIGNLATRAE